MKFKYTIQSYQTAAVRSVVDVFEGQSHSDRFTYRRDVEGLPLLKGFEKYDTELMGFANSPITIDGDQILDNVKRVQQNNGLKVDRSLFRSALGACSLDVEMETGTGKTYVYIKTMFELNAHYGWSKFIVVVPSIAIREGVLKSFNDMEDHFMEQYGKKARAFVYDSKNLALIDSFSQSSDINVMIINTQAFNSSFNKDKNREGRAGDSAARIIYSERDDFGSRRPIDVIAANNPIVIMDEPQKMAGIQTQTALKQFSPLFVLNYSATHKEHHTLVYALDALDAYNMRIVKQIEVKGFDIKNLRGTKSYLYLENIVVSPDKPPRARLEFEVANQKSIKRETRLVGVDDDLYALSKNMEQYRGYRVSEVDPILKRVSFTNGKTIDVGTVAGDVSERDIRRVQIRETIRSHFEKEKDLFSRNIKCLSLFFIDEVAKYRKYDDDGNEINSEYGEMFEEEYKNIYNEFVSLFNTPYEQYLKSIDVHATHAGYFSIDKKSGRKIDSATRGRSDESDDISAYDLILKDKKRLLSFDTPVRFIFSHSALREGWDNPNVFQICTLKHGGSSPIQKRQEVGRGLRLCVNQDGDRMDATTLHDDVFLVNQLTVIASDGYDTFVSDLQKGIREDLYDRPTKASPAFFIGKTINVDGKQLTVTEKQGNAIYKYLAKNDYIDDEDHVTDTYRIAFQNEQCAPIPTSCKELENGVHLLIQSINDPNATKEMIKDGRETKITDNPLNDNFNKEEFQRLWKLIHHKYAYTVEFDSEELIQKAIAHIDKELYVSELYYTVTTGRQEDEWSIDRLNNGRAFTPNDTHRETLNVATSSQVKYDLIGKIAAGAILTRRSAARILAGIRHDKFAMFQKNPEEFISKTIRLINEQKATMIVEQVTYNRTEGTYDSAIFTAEKRGNFSNAYQSKKNIQKYVFPDGFAKDGDSIERRFAEDMDAAQEVAVYAKLPKGFAIPTPVGNYSPDWAIAFYKGTVKHIFFVAETKGSMESLQLRSIEQAKINCAKKLFAGLSSDDVVYHEVDNYQNLLSLMDSL